MYQYGHTCIRTEMRYPGQRRWRQLYRQTPQTCAWNTSVEMQPTSVEPTEFIIVWCCFNAFYFIVLFSKLARVAMWMLLHNYLYVTNRSSSMVQVLGIMSAYSTWKVNELSSCLSSLLAYILFHGSWNKASPCHESSDPLIIRLVLDVSYFGQKVFASSIDNVNK